MDTLGGLRQRVFRTVRRVKARYSRVISVKDQAGTDQVSGPAALGTEYLHSTAMFPLDFTVS